MEMVKNINKFNLYSLVQYRYILRNTITYFLLINVFIRKQIAKISSKKVVILSNKSA